ncbi:MAG: GNAT family N-acetyltransferase, partial [Pseudomonadota bacterium]
GLYEAFFASLPARDLRMRFFSSMRRVPPSMIATLTQIDYARAMAFVALDPADGRMLGAVRLSTDADGERAEYGVAVRSDLAGKGLGTALMRRIIRHGREIGLAEIWGDVLAENAGMLHVAGRLGFEAAPSEEGVVQVALRMDSPAAEAA